MNSELPALEKAINTYLDGLYEGDAAKLAEVFHPSSHLYSGTDGKVVDLPAPDWFEAVKKRPSPKSKGDARADQILSIDFNGPVTAFVKVNCAVPPRFFTDYLTFVKLDGRWQVIAKVYHFETKAG